MTARKQILSKLSAKFITFRLDPQLSVRDAATERSLRGKFAPRHAWLRLLRILSLVRVVLQACSGGVFRALVPRACRTSHQGRERRTERRASITSLLTAD